MMVMECCWFLFILNGLESKTVPPAMVAGSLKVGTARCGKGGRCPAGLIWSLCTIWLTSYGKGQCAGKRGHGWADQ
jgi:hypothetical protein